MTERHAHGGTDAPECTTCRSVPEPATSNPGSKLEQVGAVGGGLSEEERLATGERICWNCVDRDAWSAVERIVREQEAAAWEEVRRLRGRITALADVIHGDSGWEHNSGCEGEPDCFACIELDLRAMADSEADR